MRCYYITGEGQLPKYVGTQAEVSATKKAFMAEGLKRKDIAVSEVDVPDDKQGKLDFLNKIVKLHSTAG